MVEMQALNVSMSVRSVASAALNSSLFATEEVHDVSTQYNTACDLGVPALLAVLYFVIIMSPSMSKLCMTSSANSTRDRISSAPCLTSLASSVTHMVPLSGRGGEGRAVRHVASSAQV